MIGLHSYMLQSLSWDIGNAETELPKLERIMLLIHSSSETADAPEYAEFWEHVIQRNIYIAALLCRRLENFSPGAHYAAVGAHMIREALDEKKLDDSDVMWRFLAELETNFQKYAIDYVRYIKDKESKASFPFCINALGYSSDLPGKLLSLCTVLADAGDIIFFKDLFPQISKKGWSIEATTDEHRQNLQKIVSFFLKEKELAAFMQFMSFCDGWRLSDICRKSDEEWIEYLSDITPGVAIIFYQKVLEREALSPEERLRALYRLTAWSNGDVRYSLNNYIYFAHAVTILPERYDEHAALLSECDIMDENATVISEERGRWPKRIRSIISYAAINEPLGILIEKNPEKVLDFLRKIRPINSYNDQSKANFNIMDSTELEINPARPRMYITYINECIKNGTYTPKELVEIYMNSPFKSCVDLTWLIRKLFRPSDGFVNLNPIFGKYIFSGKLVEQFRIDRTERKTFDLVATHIACRHTMTVHRGWITHNPEAAKWLLIPGNQVLFKIQSVNHRDIIFVDSLAEMMPSPTQQSKPRYAVTKAFKMVRRLAASEFFPFPDGANDRKELILLKVINQEGKILVEKISDGKEECLPARTMHPNEDPSQTLWRIVKKLMRVRETVRTQKCCTRHVYNGEERKITVHLYTLSLSDMPLSKISNFTANPIAWRTPETFSANLEDDLSRRLLEAFNAPGTEENIQV